MAKVYATREGFAKLQEERQKVVDELRTVQSQKGEAAETGGDAWHDNFSFEDLERRERMLNRRLGDMNEVLASIEVVEGRPDNTERLSIGHLAHLDVDGEERTYLIGGYGSTDLQATPPVISYDAPLIRHFIGHEVGHEATVTLAGQRKSVELVAIELPE